MLTRGALGGPATGGSVMFVQVIEGNVADRDALYRQLDRWAAEVAPGATGYLGSTGGVTADGRAVLMARFESAEAARANSARPEQGQWWAETEKCFDGEVSFADSVEVETFGEAAFDSAGFVQVMKGGGADRERMVAMDRAFEPHMAGFRPDLLGGVRVWTGPGSYVEAAYFTSEADARANEQNEPPAALAELMGDFGEMMAGVEFLDLREPKLVSG